MNRTAPSFPRLDLKIADHAQQRFLFARLRLLPIQKSKENVMYATPIAAPPWIDDHDINYNELIKISGVNRNTAIMHQRTLLASGRRCGRKIRGLWFFSTRETYFFLIIAALSHGKIPISLEILSGAWDFAQKHPDVPFALSSRCAVTTVDAAALWNSVIEMMTDVRAALEKAGVNV